MTRSASTGEWHDGHVGDKRRSGERPAAVFQHAHECPARKVRRRAIVGPEGQAEPTLLNGRAVEVNIMIKKGLQALGIVAPCREAARYRSSTNVVP
jgi:hypothetical protein